RRNRELFLVLHVTGVTDREHEDVLSRSRALDVSAEAEDIAGRLGIQHRALGGEDLLNAELARLADEVAGAAVGLAGLALALALASPARRLLGDAVFEASILQQVDVVRLHCEE